MANDLNKDSFKEFITKNEKCVVDFWAPWCGPCKMLQPKITEACEEKNVPLGGINIDEDKELAQEYGVMSIPCVIKFEKGEEADRKIGNVSKESLIDFLS
jgi:thioredoxin 1